MSRLLWHLYNSHGKKMSGCQRQATGVQYHLSSPWQQGANNFEAIPFVSMATKDNKPLHGDLWSISCNWLFGDFTWCYNYYLNRFHLSLCLALCVCVCEMEWPHPPMVTSWLEWSVHVCLPVVLLDWGWAVVADKGGVGSCGVAMHGCRGRGSPCTSAGEGSPCIGAEGGTEVQQVMGWFNLELCVTSQPLHHQLTAWWMGFITEVLYL